ncbi:MAG: YeeE/YedE family protein [Christensenellaceae bacterium]|nr:YeeE/YedE family protein [Christensenellaceae bacterium]
MSTIVFGGLTGLLLGMAAQAAGLTDAGRFRDMLAFRRFCMLKMTLAFLGFGALMVAFLGWLAVLDVDLLTVRPLDWATLLGGVLLGAGVWLCGLLPGTALGAIGGGRLWESFCAVAGCLVGAVALPWVTGWTQPLHGMAWSQATVFRVTLDSPYLLPGGFLGLGIFGFVLLALAAYVPVPQVREEVPQAEEIHHEHIEEVVPVILPGEGSIMADAVDPAAVDDEIMALDEIEEEPEEVDGDVEDEVPEEPVMEDHPDLDPEPEDEDMTEALVEMEERAGIGTYVSEEAMPVNARVLVKPDADEIGAAEEEKEESREPVGKA